MSKKFIISDTHFQHQGVYKFTRSIDSDERIRPWATNSEEGDAFLIEKWNSVVSKNDMVWHLGDVCWTKESLKILEKLNGTKHLVLGNHDHFPVEEYLKYFSKVYGILYHKEFIFSHFPIHTSSFSRRFKVNIHGHLHDKTIKVRFLGEDIDDPRYFNVSVESPHRQLLNVEPGVPIDVSNIVEYFKTPILETAEIIQ